MGGLAPPPPLIPCSRWGLTCVGACIRELRRGAALAEVDAAVRTEVADVDEAGADAVGASKINSAGDTRAHARRLLGGSLFFSSFRNALVHQPCERARVERERERDCRPKVSRAAAREVQPSPLFRSAPRPARLSRTAPERQRERYTDTPRLGSLPLAPPQEPLLIRRCAGRRSVIDVSSAPPRVRSRTATHQHPHPTLARTAPHRPTR